MKISKRDVMNILAIIVFLGIGAIYYYGLHTNFWPNPEECMQTAKYYWKDNFGIDYVKGEFIAELTSRISYQLFGVGIRGLRVLATIRYAIILLVTVFLSIDFHFGRKIKYCLFTVIIFTAVLLHPGSSAYCGYHTLSYHLYPYDTHTTSVTYCLFGSLLIYIYMQLKSKRFKQIVVIGTVLFLLYGVRKADMIFLIGFVLPLLLCGFSLLYKRNKKILYGACVGGMVLLAILRIASQNVVSLQSLFSQEPVYYGQWNIYGNISIINPAQIGNNIINTFSEMLALFNVDPWGKGILSIYTIICAIRIALVGLILFFSVKSIVSSFRNEEEDIVNLVFSLGIFCNLLVLIFTEHGSGKSCIRYMTLILFYGTIILCRNVGKWLETVKDSRKIQRMLAIFMLSGIVINISPVWKEDSYQTEYEKGIQNVVKIIEENELGNGLASYWCATTMTALLDGKYEVMWGYEDDAGMAVMDWSIPVYYFVDGPDAFKSFNVENIYNCYGEPDQIYSTDGFTIYYYEDGIDWDMAG